MSATGSASAASSTSLASEHWRSQKWHPTPTSSLDKARGPVLTIDRYVLRMFVNVLVKCFASLLGLYVVVDCLGHLDESS